MNIDEGVKRLATVIRWVGDGVGVICVFIELINFGNSKHHTDR